MSMVYDQSTLGTANNSITFNDFTASPIFLLEETLPTRREIREQDAPIPGESGVADFESQEGRSYFILRGEMFARTEAEYYEGKRTLRKVGSLEIQQDDALSDFGYVLYQWTEAGSPRAVAVKVQYTDRMGEEMGNGYSQDFALICKVKYPVIINPAAVTFQLGVSSVGVPTGHTGYPFGYSIGYGATTYAASGSVNNEGDLGAYPSMSIVGPVNLPKVTNLTTGEYLEVNVNLATSSDILSINYDQDTAPSILLNGVSVYDKKTTGSTFFKIVPGGNNLQLTGSSINGGMATGQFYSTWPMS